MVSDSDIDEFTEILDDAADFIADEVIPVIKDLFDFIVENKGAVISAIQGIERDSPHGKRLRLFQKFLVI